VLGGIAVGGAKPIAALRSLIDAGEALEAQVPA